MRRQSELRLPVCDAPVSNLTVTCCAWMSSTPEADRHEEQSERPFLMHLTLKWSALAFTTRCCSTRMCSPWQYQSAPSNSVHVAPDARPAAGDDVDTATAPSRTSVAPASAASRARLSPMRELISSFSCKRSEPRARAGGEEPRGPRARGA